MNADLKMVLGGIGLLIFTYLLIRNASNFSKITDSVANDSATVIKTLQGNG